MATRPSGVSNVAATAQPAAVGSSPRERRQTSSSLARRRPRPGARKESASEDDGLETAIEAELAIVAEVGEAKLAHGEECRRSARYGVGRISEGADGLCRHTRIGMST